MDVVVSMRVVVFGAPLAMSMSEDSDFFEQLEGAVDGRCVHSGDLTPHSLDEIGGSDVTSAGHDLDDDGSPLRGHAVPALPQQLENLVGVKYRSRSHILFKTLAIGGRSITP